MKNPTLFFCVFLTIIVEVIVAYLVYQKIGNERISISIVRLIIQLIILISIPNFKVGLYLLTFYHLILCLVFFTKGISFDVINFIFGLYHFLIGLLIYFNEEIDIKLKDIK